MANPLDPVLGHHTSKERQPAAVPELLKNQPHQPPKQSNADDHAEEIEAARAEEQTGFSAERSTTEIIGTKRVGLGSFRR